MSETYSNYRKAVMLYRERYAKRLVDYHNYTAKEARQSADGAEIDWLDFEPKDHADDEASYARNGG